jgi:hypothetical protein
MTNLLKSKLTKKAVLLFALIAALGYLRTPGPALAHTCIGECIDKFDSCFAACDGNDSCIAVCTADYSACEHSCLPPG